MSATSRRVVILGCTGSVGRQALDVISRLPDRLEVVGLVAGSDAAGLAEQAERARVERTGLGGDAAAAFAAMDDADVVLNAVVGAAGLRASLAALEAGKTLALANKESLIAGGEACKAAARRGGGRIVPVDSEHAALAQCLQGRGRDEIRRMVITASGGPFRERADLSAVTREEALAHPTWAMGPKITIDSATMMNKGLEVIEAHHLFGVRYDDIDVVVHPQSIIHGAVELNDGSMVMHAAVPDMRVPIQWALLDDAAAAEPYARLDLASLGSIHFEPLDSDRFPAVALAYDAGRRGRSYPAVLNAANEVAVYSFLEGRLGFAEIVLVVQEVLEVHQPIDVTSLDAVMDADAWARSIASDRVQQRPLAATGGRG